ncbi:MAG TPA: CNNM domain-containing protein [Gemmatimonadaceae bacterium]|nr:CNNM domain-containing protein [Gemmatimonadaceae bacterium]
MTTPSPVLSLLIAAFIVAWLTAASIAVRSTSRIWLRHWIEHQPAGFDVAERFLERPTRLIIAAASGNALATVIAGAIVTAWAPRGARTALYLVVATLFLLVVGKIIPRAIARRWPSRLVPVLLPPLQIVEVLLWPLIALSRRVERFADRDKRALDQSHDGRDNIEDLLREGEMEGVGARDEIAIITGVVRFGEKTLRNVMTPRAQIFALDESLPPDELARRIADSKYSRVPITRHDSLDEIVGMVHAFDVLRAEGEAPDLRPVPDARADARCNDLLYRMLRASAHLAVVRDPDGRTAGIVTLEDLLEELVGDIRDEHDEAGPVPRTASSS